MKVGVIGAGTMGAGIAQAFAATEGYEVVLCDISEEFAAGGKGKIEASLNKLVSKGKITEGSAQELLGKITTGLRDKSADCDLVIEAVLEKMEVKQELFGALQKICRPDCIFASNTSSLSLTEMAKDLDRPVIGMHFFNPAPVMKLVEVIAGYNTTPEQIETVMKIAEEIGKVPVQVQEAAGFVVNRILVPMVNEAAELVAAGTASAEDVDKAMQLGANHPIGPLAVGDLVGLDVIVAILEVLQAETGLDKYAPSPLLRKMVRAGVLGRKTGRGFFDYSR